MEGGKKMIGESSTMKHGPHPEEKQKKVQSALAYDVNSLSWDEKHHYNKEQIYCYCGGSGQWNKCMLQCRRCQQWFHGACLSCLRYPLLYGDRFYIFVCAICNEGTEFLHRLDLKWVDMVHLAIYNLACTKSNSFFELDDTIIRWINDNWKNMQLTKGFQKTKVNERMDKVKRVLEMNKPRFRSGREFKKKSNIWRLRNTVPPPVPDIILPISGVINKDSIEPVIQQYKQSRLRESASKKQKSSRSRSRAVDSSKKGEKQGKGEEEEGMQKKKREHEINGLAEDKMSDISWVRFHKEGKDCTCSMCTEIEDFIQKVEEEAAGELRFVLEDSDHNEVIEATPRKTQPSKSKSSRQKPTLSSTRPSNYSHMSTSDQLVKITKNRPTVPGLVSKRINNLQHKRHKQCMYCHSTFKKTCGLKSHIRTCKWARISYMKPQNKVDSSEKIATSLPVKDQFVEGIEKSVTLPGTGSELKSGLQVRPNQCDYCYRSFKTPQAAKSHIRSCKQRALTDHIEPRKSTSSSIENVTSLHIPDQSVNSAENKASLPGTLSKVGKLLDEKPIECSYCHGAFKTTSGLKCHLKTCKVAKAYHIKSKDNTDTSFKMDTSLPVPNQALKNTENMEPLPGTLSELSSRIQNENILQCDHCSTTFKKIESLKSHIKTCKLVEYGHMDLQKKTDSLARIESSLPTSDQVMEGAENRATLSDTHDSRLLNCKPFECTNCSSTFKTGRLLVCHARSCYKTKTVIRKMILSKLKKKSKAKTTMGEETQIDRTIRTISQKVDTDVIVDRPLRCLYCRKTYETQNSLDMHIGTHMEEKPEDVRLYSCAFCKAAFQRVRSLRVHIMTHTGEKPFKCNYCSSSFRSKGQQILHHRIHTGEKPFKCSMCDASFARSGSLTIHIRIHSGDKPYQCCKCSLSFARKDRLNSHMLKHT